MKHVWNESELTIILPERIDASNAAEAEEEVRGIISGKKVEKIILDGAEMEYISSAGLRLVLKLVKMIKNVKVVNVSNDVYGIFDLAGFVDMIIIEKAED